MFGISINISTTVLAQSVPSGNEMAGNETTDMDEILAELVRKLPVLYDKSAKDFKDKHKKERAWDDVAKEVGFPTGKSLWVIFFL